MALRIGAPPLLSEHGSANLARGVPMSRPLNGTTLRASNQRPTLRRSAAGTEQKMAPPSFQPSALVQDRMDFLRKDLVHLFDEQGIDKDSYEEVVEFIDPITRYNKLSGYLFNIQFLRRIFDPSFVLHDLQQTGLNDITTRWTMRMEFALSKGTPLRKWWNPSLTFTGVSIMTVNPATGKFNKHIDLWDAVEDQDYFSMEAFQHVLAQLGDLTRTPSDLDTPNYTIMRKYKTHEIRRYEPFVVAEVKVGMPGAVKGASSNNNSGSSGSPDKGGNGAFNMLAGYIFGGNERKERMAMTMPVFSDSNGLMQFVVRSSDEGFESLPAPQSSEVELKRQGGGHFAALTFNGDADEAQVASEVAKLRNLIAASGLKTADANYVLARYNDPSTKARYRRNEVLIKIDDFELW